MISNIDYYDVLGVHQFDTIENIKANYRQLCRQYHPDKGGDAEIFELIQKAFAVLSNPETRAAYNFDRANDKQNQHISQKEEFLKFVESNEFQKYWKDKPVDFQTVCDTPMDLAEIENKMKDYQNPIEVKKYEDDVFKGKINQIESKNYISNKEIEEYIANYNNLDNVNKVPYKPVTRPNHVTSFCVNGVKYFDDGTGTIQSDNDYDQSTQYDSYANYGNSTFASVANYSSMYGNVGSDTRYDNAFIDNKLEPLELIRDIEDQPGDFDTAYARLLESRQLDRVNL